MLELKIMLTCLKHMAGLSATSFLTRLQCRDPAWVLGSGRLDTVATRTMRDTANMVELRSLWGPESNSGLGTGTRVLILIGLRSGHLGNVYDGRRYGE